MPCEPPVTMAVFRSPLMGCLPKTSCHIRNPRPARAIAADAPLTEPSTPANTVIRFASMLLMKRWFSRQRRTGLRRRDCFGATLFEPHDDNVENRRQEQTKSSYSEHSEKDRGAEGLS